MNVICLTSHLSALSYPPCHVERSETSLDVTGHIAAANDPRFFASLRMTTTFGFRRTNP
jgi:hypothetical protein